MYFPCRFENNKGLLVLAVRCGTDNMTIVVIVTILVHSDWWKIHLSTWVQYLWKIHLVYFWICVFLLVGIEVNLFQFFNILCLDCNYYKSHISFRHFWPLQQQHTLYSQASCCRLEMRPKRKQVLGPCICKIYMSTLIHSIQVQ